MTEETKIETLSDAEMDAVCGGVIGGNVTKSLVSTASISGGPGGMLSGHITGSTFSGGGMFGFVAETGSNLFFHNTIRRTVYFGVLRR